MEGVLSIFKTHISFQMSRFFADCGWTLIQGIVGTQTIQQITVFAVLSQFFDHLFDFRIDWNAAGTGRCLAHLYLEMVCANICKFKSTELLYPVSGEYQFLQHLENILLIGIYTGLTLWNALWKIGIFVRPLSVLASYGFTLHQSWRIYQVGNCNVIIIQHPIPILFDQI